MEGRMSETLPGQQAEKKEIFARVWKRVMADSTASCPIAWEDPAGETSAQPPVPPQESAPLRESAPLQAAGGGEGADQCPCLPAPAQPPRGHHPHSDFPHPGGVLGEGCLECAPLLQELIRRELADLREYQALAPPGRGQSRPGAGGDCRGEEAPGQASLGGLFSHLRGPLLAGGPGDAPHPLVLRDPPPPLCPGADHHGRLPGRGGEHRRPLPAAALLGPRQGVLGPGLPHPHPGGAELRAALTQREKGRRRSPSFCGGFCKLTLVRAPPAPVDPPPAGASSYTTHW